MAGGRGAGNGNGDSARQRILLAVAPKVLSHALAEILRRRAETDVEVIDLREGAQPPSPGRFDAAIVTLDISGGIDADVVIELPDHEVHLRGLVTKDGECDAVMLDSLESLLAVLDERLPPVDR